MQSLGTVTVTVTPVNDAPRVIAPMGTQTMLEDAADRIIDLATFSAIQTYSSKVIPPLIRLSITPIPI